jgi:hypothetical protein
VEEVELLNERNTKEELLAMYGEIIGKEGDRRRSDKFDLGVMRS